MTQFDHAPGISRRLALAFLTAAPATALAAPQASNRDAIDDAATPVMVIFQQYVTYREWLNAFPLSTPDSQMDALYAVLFAIETEMMVLPSRNATDLAAKAIVDCGFGNFADDWETSPFWQEARRLTGLDEMETTTSAEEACAGEPPEEAAFL